MSNRGRRDREPPRDFDFFRYEVWFALAVGALAAFLAQLIPVVAAAIFFVTLIGVSWGLVHLITRWTLRGRLDRRRRQEEEDERERRAVARREAASLENEQSSRRRHRRRR